MGRRRKQTSVRRAERDFLDLPLELHLIVLADRRRPVPISAPRDVSCMPRILLAFNTHSVTKEME